MTSEPGPNATEPTSPGTRLGAKLLVVGGSVSIALWLVFTSIHGPTSFNEDRFALGRDMQFWGTLLGVVPNLLIVGGLWVVRSKLLTGGGLAARIGYALVFAGLLASATLDLILGGLSAPVLLPVVALGLVILGLAPTARADRTIGTVLLLLGTLMGVAFAWALVPHDVSDPIGGYRIYGVMAHVLTGLGWILLGVAIAGRRTESAPTT